MSEFNSVWIKKPKRNLFNMSHEVKMSMNMGKLVPFFCQDVIPGDTFGVNSETMIRFAPMLAPIMHRVNVYTHFFFVPNRLVWNDWEEFITGGQDGQSLPVAPAFKTSEITRFEGGFFGSGSLLDYMGIPPLDDSTEYSPDYTFSALPFRAYQLIYNEYYRDQNLSDEIDFSRESGLIYEENEVNKLLALRNRCWEKDYFTSALPFTQRGSEVTLPLSGDATVFYEQQTGIKSGRFLVGNAGSPIDKEMIPVSNADGTISNFQEYNGDGTKYPFDYDPAGSLKADLSTVNATTINDLRTAARLQEFLERNAVAGARYKEQIAAHFGVRTSDARLQRPEYLGGGKAPVVISEVLQTSSTDDSSPLAEMAGHGISVGNTNRFKKFFEEHGYIIGIMSILPRTAYQQGTPRHFLRNDKFDYFFPEFAHLGEQPIYSQELYTGATVSPEKVFGYTPRYSEYKYIPSRVAGDFRNSLNFWHMGRIFSGEPLLNESFVTSNPTDRIFAVTDSQYHHLWVQIYNNVRAIRPIPKFSTPNL